MAVIVCDVRTDLRNGQEPFGKIMAVLSTLGPADELELYATFEPQPLYRVLAKQGFAHEAEPLPGGEWKIRFFRSAP